MLKKISFVILVVLLIGILSLNVFAVSTSKEEGGIYTGVEPLAEPVKMSIALGAGWSMSLPFYIMEQTGGFKKVGITVNFETFSDGPLMIEALKSWDFTATGLGGILSGVMKNEVVLLADSIYDSGNLKIFTRKDDPIVKAGKNLPKYPLLYGTKETWKGRTVYLAKGTTLHYMLIVALEKFGLSEKDVNIVSMSIPSAYTALVAGKGGEIAALNASVIFSSSLLEKFAPVVQATDVGADLVCMLVANRNSYEDPKKTLAIKKILEMYFITCEWIMENLDEACEKYFLPMCEYQSVKSTIEDEKKYILSVPFVTLKENYEFCTTMTEDGKMKVIEAQTYYPTEFFVNQKNYEPEILDELLSGVFNTEYIEEIYKAKQK